MSEGICFYISMIFCKEYIGHNKLIEESSVKERTNIEYFIK